MASPTITNNDHSLRSSQKLNLYPQLLSRDCTTLSPNLGSMTSLLGYDSQVRKLFLDAKINRDHYAIQTLLFIVFQSGETLQHLSHYKNVYIMPSSMWGRFKGQFDLAYSMAHLLQKHYLHNWQIKRSPLHLYWNLKKRAQTKKGHEGSLEYFDLPTPPSAQTKTLILDDMVTMGLSAVRLADSLATPCDLFTLIDSKRR